LSFEIRDERSEEMIDVGFLQQRKENWRDLALAATYLGKKRRFERTYGIEKIGGLVLSLISHLLTGLDVVAWKEERALWATNQRESEGEGGKDVPR
jgi:hypothetical protein